MVTKFRPSKHGSGYQFHKNQESWVYREETFHDGKWMDARLSQKEKKTQRCSNFCFAPHGVQHSPDNNKTEMIAKPKPKPSPANGFRVKH